jgi:hypothetical protein
MDARRILRLVRVKRSYSPGAKRIPPSCVRSTVLMRGVAGRKVCKLPRHALIAEGTSAMGARTGWKHEGRARAGSHSPFPAA